MKVQEKSNAQVLNVLLITNKEKSHYVFTKDFDRLMYSKAKTKDSHKKNTSVWLVYKISLLKKYFLIIKNNTY